MIKLCRNLFYKPKYGNDADSIMLRHLFSTVVSILVCLAAISFSAYAFFSSTVTSGSNTIQTSNFSSSVVIKNENDETITEGKPKSHRFDTPGVYTVTITADDGVTGTGYCVVNVNGTNYYTQQLGRDVNAPNQERKQISFQLDVKGTAIVTFEAHWGTNSHYNAVAESEIYIKNDPPKTIVVDATQGAADSTEDTKPEETKPEETEPDSTTETTVESTTVETTTPTTESTEIIHIVQKGESLDLIAQKYGTTRFVLAEYNKLEDPRVIQPGQKINIPPADWGKPDGTTTPETTVPTEQEHVTTLPEETQPATEATDAPLQ